MPRSGFSAQTVLVLSVLADAPGRWQHGYAVAKETGLKSGTLYPILMRLADRGLLEASWQEEPELGRPRRHLYRLTVEGRAAAARASIGATAGDRPQTRRSRPGRPAVEGS